MPQPYRFPKHVSYFVLEYRNKRWPPPWWMTYTIVRDLSLAFSIDQEDRSYEERERLVKLLDDVTDLEVLDKRLDHLSFNGSLIVIVLVLPKLLASQIQHWMPNTPAWSLGLIFMLVGLVSLYLLHHLVIMAGMLSPAYYLNFRAVVKRMVTRYERQDVLGDDLAVISTLDHSKRTLVKMIWTYIRTFRQ